MEVTMMVLRRVSLYKGNGLYLVESMENAARNAINILCEDYK